MYFVFLFFKNIENIKDYFDFNSFINRNKIEIFGEKEIMEENNQLKSIKKEKSKELWEFHFLIV